MNMFMKITEFPLNDGIWLFKGSLAKHEKSTPQCHLLTDSEALYDADLKIVFQHAKFNWKTK